MSALFIEGEDEPEDRPVRRKRNLIRCSDRTCGALDCPHCHPESIKLETEDDDD